MTTCRASRHIKVAADLQPPSASHKCLLNISKSAATSWSFTPPATHPPFSPVHATSPAIPTLAVRRPYPSLAICFALSISSLLRLLQSRYLHCSLLLSRFPSPGQAHSPAFSLCSRLFHMPLDIFSPLFTRKASP